MKARRVTATGAQEIGDIRREIGPRARDLTQNDQVRQIIGEVTEAIGPIDILVHNAGGDIAAKVASRIRTTRS